MGFSTQWPQPEVTRAALTWKDCKNWWELRNIWRWGNIFKYPRALASARGPLDITCYQSARKYPWGTILLRLVWPDRPKDQTKKASYLIPSARKLLKTLQHAPGSWQSDNPWPSASPPSTWLAKSPTRSCSESWSPTRIPRKLKQKVGIRLITTPYTGQTLGQNFQSNGSNSEWNARLIYTSTVAKNKSYVRKVLDVKVTPDLSLPSPTTLSRAMFSIPYAYGGVSGSLKPHFKFLTFFVTFFRGPLEGH